MLTGLITWWAARMRECVPAFLRPSGRLWRRALVVAADPADPGTVDLVLQGPATATRIGRCPLDPEAIAACLPAGLRRLPVVVRLPPDLLLEREITLPLAAERDLRQVLTYEMDRFTPFRAEEVHWTCHASQRDTARNQLRARMSLVARASIAPVVDALRQAGLVPAWVLAGNVQAAERVIPLLADRSRRGRLGRRAEAAVLGLCGLLAVTVAALPFVLQSLALADLDSRIEAMRPAVAQAERLRQRIASNATALEAVANARRAVGDPLRMLAVLTDLLSDDTYLTTLSWRQRKLTAAGRSGAAARVIASLAAHPAVREPTFTAPVTRDETSGQEMFSIRADMGN